jgi:uncharacterized protein RhaS with RHS repeats
MYDPALGRWGSVDAMASKYMDYSPYNYVYNNPTNAIDPNGKDGILIVFPDYKIDTETRMGRVGGLGHAGVLLIDNKTGLTKYYEYGRYPTADGTKGVVRTYAIPNVVMGNDGKPTSKSLDKVLKAISKQSGQGGRIEGAYVKSDNFKTMADYAEQKYKESNPEFKEYDKDRDSYTLTGNNCATFACDVLNQDKEVDEKTPGYFVPTPTNIVEKYQNVFDKVTYDPKTGAATYTVNKQYYQQILDWLKDATKKKDEKK